MKSANSEFLSANGIKPSICHLDGWKNVLNSSATIEKTMILSVSYFKKILQRY